MKKVILLASACIFLFSCANNSEKAPSSEETLTQGEHSHDESSAPIELNNGEKWAVNEEMKPFVLKGEELVNTFVQNSETDYKALASKVKEQDDQLVKSCTMDGKSHDELHKWLHPHMELVEKLEKSEDAEKAKAAVAELQASYQAYHQYFN